jgi:NDP-sugar pyrophosphorylase family protein
MTLFDVAILAGGLGTRIRHVGGELPKALLDVNGQPFLERQLRLLKSHGVGRAVLLVGHRAQQIEDFAGDGSRFGIKLEYAYDGPALLGTGGALRNALPLLPESFFVLYGDSYLTCDYAAVQKAFTASGKLALMTVLKNEGRWDRSNVEFVDGAIRVYDKQSNAPAFKHIDYGLGVFKRSVFEALPAQTVIDLAEIYRSVLAAGQLAAHEVPERFYEIGSPEGLEELRAFLKR